MVNKDGKEAKRFNFLTLIVADISTVVHSNYEIMYIIWTIFNAELFILTLIL